VDVLKIARLSGIALAVILTACSGELPTPPQPTSTIQLPYASREIAVTGGADPPCCDAPPEQLIHNPRILERALAIILVRGIGFEMLDPQENSIPAHATMLVIRSWKGPFSAGDVLQTPKGFLATTYNGIVIDGAPIDTDPMDHMVPYPFQSGDQGKYFLIMDNRGFPPPDRWVWVGRYAAWPAEKSRALMAALDQAVVDSMPTDKAGYVARLQKERTALEDLETKMQAVRDRRTALDKQLPGDETAFNQAGVELNNLNNLRLWRLARAARWQQELRNLGWTPPQPPTAGAPRSGR
jgi:hypothetical protein